MRWAGYSPAMHLLSRASARGWWRKQAAHHLPGPGDAMAARWPPMPSKPFVVRFCILLLPSYADSSHYSVLITALCGWPVMSHALGSCMVYCVHARDQRNTICIHQKTPSRITVNKMLPVPCMPNNITGCTTWTCHLEFRLYQSYTLQS